MKAYYDQELATDVDGEVAYLSQFSTHQQQQRDPQNLFGRLHLSPSPCVFTCTPFASRNVLLLLLSSLCSVFYRFFLPPFPLSLSRARSRSLSLLGVKESR